MPSNFIKGGPSPNPKGRPKITKKDERCQLRNMLKPHAQDLLNKAVSMALKGNESALRLCVDHVLPRLRPTSEPQALNIELTGTPMQQSQTILEAITRGEISLDDGAMLINSVAATVKIREATELEARLAALEQSQIERVSK